MNYYMFRLLQLSIATTVHKFNYVMFQDKRDILLLLHLNLLALAFAYRYHDPQMPICDFFCPSKIPVLGLATATHNLKSVKIAHICVYFATNNLQMLIFKYSFYSHEQ